MFIIKNLLSRHISIICNCKKKHKYKLTIANTLGTLAETVLYLIIMCLFQDIETRGII